MSDEFISFVYLECKLQFWSTQLFCLSLMAVHKFNFADVIGNEFLNFLMISVF